jgi:hypothetical protein
MIFLACIAQIFIAQALALTKDNVLGTWSEQGCSQEVVRLQNWGHAHYKIWAGAQFGWIEKNYYWELTENTVSVFEIKNDPNSLFETWEITEVQDKQLKANRKAKNRDARSVSFTACE